MYTHREVGTEKCPRKDTAIRWPSANQGEKPQKKPTLLAP